MGDKIWANSGDSHLIEPADIWDANMPSRMAARMPRSVKDPDGEWETVDFIDRDPAGGEGMIPIRIKMTIKGDRAIYDFTGSHPTIGSIYNSAFGSTFSAVAAAPAGVLR